MTWVWVENEDWLPDLTPALDGWEPWQPDPEDTAPDGACSYCAQRQAVRTEPFGDRRCCDPCFNVIIGGDEDDEPWRCGTRPVPGSGTGAAMTLTSHQRPHRGATDVWLTPPEIIEAVGPFDLDPCAAPEPRPWPTAKHHVSLPVDGLSGDWKGFVWCNPPFGPEAGRWLSRMAGHGHGIALVPARTETRWFVETVWHPASAILFLHGRPHFHHPDGTRGKANSGAPICLVAYGNLAIDRLRGSGLPGALVAGWPVIPRQPDGKFRRPVPGSGNR